MNAPLPAAVLWDMDGTLIDSERYWIAAEERLFRDHGLHWGEDDALRMVGLGLWDAAEYMRARGIPMPADDIVWLLVDRVAADLGDLVPWRPGARELVAAIHEAGIPQAIVTMSVRRLAEAVAQEAPHGALSTIVAGEEVSEPKPHPEPYLRGAQALGVEPARALAFEDSVPGVTSAHAAGLITIGVPNIVPLDAAPAHELWQTLDGRTVADLAHAVARLRPGAA